MTNSNLPGNNNAFISPDIKEKYIQILDLKTEELCNRFPLVRYSIISEILNCGFLIGNEFSAEFMTENELKDKYL